MERTRLGIIALAALALVGCTGATMTDGPSPAAPGSGAPSSGAPASGMTITRTGGIAGVDDVLEIAADGTATLTRKTGEASPCTPSPAALEALRAIDLAAVGSAAPKSPIADGFNYTVISATGTATAGDGEAGIRAEFVQAAAAVLASCEAMLVGSDAPYQ